jgi:hypothetical protein
MAQTCSFCQQEIGQVPKLERLCHHFFHTTCFFVNMGDQCIVCEQPFLQDGAFQVEDQEDTLTVESNHSEETEETDEAAATRVLNLYNTNRHFRRDIKTYVQAASSVSRPRRELHKLIALKKTELSEPYALIKAQYEGLYNTKKDELVQSEPYKAYKRADARTQRLYTNLGTKYRLYSYHFAALQTIPGLKRLRRSNRWRYYSRPISLIRRALRLRLPWW